MNTRDTIFKVIKEYLSDNSIYKPQVTARADDDNYPKVVVNIERSISSFQSIDAIDVIGTYNLIIDIYAKDLEDGTSSIDICEEIEQHLYNLLTKKMHFKITFSRNTPNIDNSIYRITMRYTCTML